MVVVGADSWLSRWRAHVGYRSPRAATDSRTNPLTTDAIAPRLDFWHVTAA
jgi:hypothetical protein